MLDLAILGLLENRELHGYEIRRQLREGLGLLANVSFGSLYPALARLEAAGAVEAVESGALGAPATGSLSGEWAVFRARRHASGHGRRSRKVYRITDRGRELFNELLAGASSPDDDRSFSLRLALARHLAPQARLALLERRRLQLLERLDEVAAAANQDSLDPYARSVVEHTADGVRHDLVWLDRLIAVERTSPESGPADTAPLDPAPAAVITHGPGHGDDADSALRPA